MEVVEVVEMPTPWAFLGHDPRHDLPEGRDRPGIPPVCPILSIPVYLVLHHLREALPTLDERREHVVPAILELLSVEAWSDCFAQEHPHLGLDRPPAHTLGFGVRDVVGV